MAKVDSQVRRRELAEAVWRVVLRDGVESASVRKVAAEAGLSTGSLRHVFPSQSELLTFAMQLVIDEVARRIENVERSGDVADVVEHQLRSLLVLDEESRAIFEIWLAFSTRARVDRSLRPLRDETHARVRELCRQALEALRSAGRLRLDLDVAGEAERLHALVDGLAMHGTLDPETTTPLRQTELLASHLELLR